MYKLYQEVKVPVSCVPHLEYLHIQYGLFLKKTNGLDGAAVLFVHFPFEMIISS